MATSAEAEGRGYLPLPIATIVNYALTGWETDIVLLLDVSEQGEEYVTLWTYREPYATSPEGDRDMSDRAEALVRRHALEEFGRRLQRFLAQL